MNLSTPEDFADKFLKGNISFEEALNILNKQGAKITMQYNDKADYRTSRFEKITYELDGKTYSVSRTVKPELLTDNSNVSNDIKSIATDFKLENLTINEAIEKLKALGAENFMKYDKSSYNYNTGNATNFRSLYFDLNGIFYQITSAKAEGFPAARIINRE